MVLAVLLSAGVSLSQTAIRVPVSDPVYSALELFEAHSLFDNLLLGQRPFSRWEIARLLDEAQRRWSNTGSKPSPPEAQLVGALLNQFTSEYAPEIEHRWSAYRFVVRHRAIVSTYATSAIPRQIPASNGVGQIDTRVTSFGAYDNGRFYARGLSSFLETQHEIRLSRGVSLWLEPQFLVREPRVSPMRLYASIGWRNVGLQVGRDNLIWGYGSSGGLLLSSNARPLDMVQVYNPKPFRMPWFFRALGPTRLTFFVANLGPDQALSYPYLYGLKASIKPSRFLELGFSHLIEIGGNGAPAVSFWDALTELLPIQKITRNLHATDFSNHQFGALDFRVRLAPLRNTTLYGETLFDDSPGRALAFPGNLMNQMSFRIGLFVPRVNPSGSVSLRLDYQHLAPWAYRHSRWITGNTLGHRVLGSALGPAADGFTVTGGYRASTDTRGDVQLSYETYRSDLYTQTQNQNGGNERVVRSVDGPDEERFRAESTLRRNVSDAWSVKTQVGLEYIRRFGFVSGQNRTNGLLGVEVARSFGDPAR